MLPNNRKTGADLLAAFFGIHVEFDELFTEEEYEDHLSEAEDLEED